MVRSSGPKLPPWQDVGKTPPRVKSGDEVEAEIAAREREKAKADLRRRLFDENDARLEAARGRGDKRTITKIVEEIDKQVEASVETQRSYVDKT